MKIIEEIEKSRLSEKEMNAITGGISVTIGEQCSEKVPFISCTSRYQIIECYAHLQCPDSYTYCTGSEREKYDPCKGYYAKFKVS